MQKLFLSFFLGCLIFFCFSQNGITISDHRSLLAAYHIADKAYHTAEDLAVKSDADESLVQSADDEYRKALKLFNSLLPDVEKAGYDSLSFFIYLKSGIVYHYFDSLAEAKKCYIGALKFRSNRMIADSFFFKPMLFCGSISYTRDNIDSALYYLKMAEQINDAYKGSLSESQRLYNLFGVINYETGNYSQAVNYFEKALSILESRHPAEKNLRANYRINIASTLMKIEEYDRAKEMLMDALKENEFSNELNHKLGIINLKEKNYLKAIEYFRKTV
jgi:tetratricopeptide (TPR) repeat protein